MLVKIGSLEFCRKCKKEEFGNAKEIVPLDKLGRNTPLYNIYREWKSSYKRTKWSPILD